MARQGAAGRDGLIRWRWRRQSLSFVRYYSFLLQLQLHHFERTCSPPRSTARLLLLLLTAGGGGGPRGLWKEEDGGAQQKSAEFRRESKTTAKK